MAKARLGPEGAVIPTDSSDFTGYRTRVPVGDKTALHDFACVGRKKILAYHMPAVDDAPDMAGQILHPNSGQVMNG